MSNTASTKEFDWYVTCAVDVAAAGVKLVWASENINNLLITTVRFPPGDPDHAGVSRFELALGGRGTTVRVNIEYQPPVGKLGVVAASLLGVNAERPMKIDLSRMNQLHEAGEISSVVGALPSHVLATSTLVSQENDKTTFRTSGSIILALVVCLTMAPQAP